MQLNADQIIDAMITSGCNRKQIESTISYAAMYATEQRVHRLLERRDRDLPRDKSIKAA